MNFQLLRAIKARGFTQRDFAKVVGDHESVVSRIVNGVWNPDTSQKIRYAKALGVRQEDIFGKS